MENYGKWKVEKSLYNNPKIAIERRKKELENKRKEKTFDRCSYDRASGTC